MSKEVLSNKRAITFNDKDYEYAEYSESTKMFLPYLVFNYTQSMDFKF